MTKWLNKIRTAIIYPIVLHFHMFLTMGQHQRSTDTDSTSDISAHLCPAHEIIFNQFKQWRFVSWLEPVSDHMNDYLSDSVIFYHFYVIFSNQNRLSDRQNLKSFRLQDFLRKFIRQLYEQLSRSCFRLTGDTQRIDQKLKIRISTWIIRSLIWEDPRDPNFSF